MKLNIRQTISNLLDENRQIIRTSTSEAFVLYPEEGKKLKNKATGEITEGFVYLNNEEKLKDYEEIDL